LGALNKLFDDIVKIFKGEYEMVGIEEWKQYY
jgi:hypothetical protein